jgi:type I restriction enzyme R subunit
MRRALVNLNPEQVARNEKYVMKSTGDDALGKAQLDNFINPKKPYPVIATTSELMSTGVDAKTCKLVVLDQSIASMTKFKQIIGRGTRIDDKYNKLWFTILDFKKATELFADERFDGTPERVITIGADGIIEGSTALDDIISGADSEAAEPMEHGASGTETDSGSIDGLAGPAGDGAWEDDEPRVRKFHVNGVAVKAIAERVQYYDTDGKLVTESFRDYTCKSMAGHFASLDEFIKKWHAAERKQVIIDELADAGILWDLLAQEVGKDLDPFDLICHVVYDQPPLTRKERAESVKKRNYFAKYSDTAQTVLSTLLDKYADDGVQEIESIHVLKVKPFDQLGRPIEIVKKGFGDKQSYLDAVSALEAEIYRRVPHSA